MLYEKAGPEAAGLLRITVFGLWCVLILQSPPLALAAAVPPELFQPKGILTLLPGGFWDLMLRPAALTGFTIALVGVTLAAVLGVGPFALIGPLAFAGVLLFDGIQKSFGGFINHAQMAPLYAALLVAVSPSADALRLGRRREASLGSAALRPAAVYRFPLVGTALLLSIAYSLIGLHRVTTGGVQVFTGDALPTYLALRTFEYASYNFQLSPYLLAWEPAVFALKVGFAVTTLFEILSPLILLSRRFRLAWLAVIVPFHFLSLLTMNIFFWENLVLMAVLFAGVQQGRSIGPTFTPGTLPRSS